MTDNTSAAPAPVLRRDPLPPGHDPALWYVDIANLDVYSAPDGAIVHTLHQSDRVTVTEFTTQTSVSWAKLDNGTYVQAQFLSQ